MQSSLMDPCSMKSIDEAADIETGKMVPCSDAGIPVLKGLDVLNWSKKPCSSSSSSSCGTPLKMKHLLIRIPESLMDNTSLCHFLELFPAALSTKHIQSLESLAIANSNGSFTSLDIIQEDEEKPGIISKRYHGVLVAATVLAAATFHAALRSPAVFSRHHAKISHLFVLFNSAAFFASLAVITLLTRRLLVKPWLWIVLLSSVGAYVCAIMAASPDELGTVVLAGNCILIAAWFKHLALHRVVAHLVQWVLTRIRVV